VANKCALIVFKFGVRPPCEAVRVGSDTGAIGCPRDTAILALLLWCRSRIAPNRVGVLLRRGGLSQILSAAPHLTYLYVGHVLAGSFAYTRLARVCGAAQFPVQQHRHTLSCY